MLTTDQIKQLIETDNLAAFYNDKYWRKLSHEVIKENHNECELCKRKGKQTPAVLTHHVMRLRKYPELAYSKTYTAPDGSVHTQLMPLCFDCHEKEHGRGIYAVRKGFTNEEKW